MAIAISGLLPRHWREALIADAGESQEIDFSIPRGLAIAIFGVTGEVNLGDLDGAAITVDQLLSLDGPALASNALSTQALYEAHEVLEPVIFRMNTKVDNQTSGATLMNVVKGNPLDFVSEPILTARNPGFAGLSQGASGEIFGTIWYKWVRISDPEFIRLLVDLRT